MLSKENLISPGYVPIESDIDIKIIQEFYEYYLMPYVFVYHLNENIDLTLKFHRSNFCHLLGLHYITSDTTLHKKLRGESGYNRIKNNGLSLSTLENINKHQYALNKNRIIYFPYVYQLLQNPHVIEFDKAKLKDCMVDCDMIFYDEYHNMNIHLGIRGEPNDFFPVTFIVEPIGNTYKGDKFIRGQKHRNVCKVDIIPRI